MDLTAALGDRRRLSERTLYWRYGKNVAVRQGRWKLVRQGGAQFQLFDLDRDIAETTDLKAKESEVAARLAEGLARLDAQMAPPRWT